MNLLSRKLVLGLGGIAANTGIVLGIAEIVPDLLTTEIIYLAMVNNLGIAGIAITKQAEIDKVTAANGGSK